ncbi:MAG: 6-bladed beta-propeller [Bacteroidales bacterium]
MLFRFSSASCIFVYFVLLFTGCKENESNNFPIKIKVDPSSVDSIYDLSSSIDTFFYVNLETSKESIITPDALVEYSGDKIYMFDEMWGKSWCFDLKGKFLFSMFEKGRGPKEMDMPYSMYYDKQENQLLFVDRNRQCIHFVDSSGMYLKKVDVGVYVTFVSRIDSSSFIIVCDGFVDANLLLTRDNFNTLISTGIQLNNYSTSLSAGACPFSNAPDGSVNFALGLYDTVCNFNSKELTYRYYIDFGKYSLPCEHKCQDARSVFYIFKDNNNQYAGGINKFSETNRYIVFRFIYSSIQKRVYYLYDKLFAKGIVFKSISFHGYKLSGSWFKYTNGWYVGVVNSVEDNGVGDCNRIMSNKDKQFIDLLLQRDSKENPILFFYKFRS